MSESLIALSVIVLASKDIITSILIVFAKMKPSEYTSLGRLARLGIQDVKYLARLRREFVTDLENSELVPDFRSDYLCRSSYSNLFWMFYLLHLFQAQSMPDDLRLFTKTLMSGIVDELSRRDFLDFILFSDDIPE